MCRVQDSGVCGVQGTGTQDCAMYRGQDPGLRYVQGAGLWSGLCTGGGVQKCTIHKAQGSGGCYVQDAEFKKFAV